MSWPRTSVMGWHRYMAYLILPLGVICSSACGASTTPQTPPTHPETEVALQMETVEAYLERFNAWYKKANLPISQGYEIALSELVLEDGEEWDCYWEMDYTTINPPVRDAILANDLLHPDLAQAWLAIWDSLNTKKEICSIGRLFFGEKYAIPSYGDKMGEYYLPTDGIHQTNGETQAIFVPEYLCGGSTVTGVVHVHLQQEKPEGFSEANGKLLLTGSEYREEE